MENEFGWRMEIGHGTSDKDASSGCGWPKRVIGHVRKESVMGTHLVEDHPGEVKLDEWEGTAGNSARRWLQ